MITAYVDESGHLEIDLPAGFPAGRVEIIVQRIAADDVPAEAVANVQAQLVTVGLLPADNLEDTEPLSDDALDRMAKTAEGERSLAEDLTEDEDEY